ncbi:MAG: hypothetical protein ACT4PT_08910 [Methanobacteriota archaeon]
MRLVFLVVIVVAAFSGCVGSDEERSAPAPVERAPPSNQTTAPPPPAPKPRTDGHEHGSHGATETKRHPIEVFTLRDCTGFSAFFPADMTRIRASVDRDFTPVTFGNQSAVGVLFFIAHTCTAILKGKVVENFTDVLVITPVEPSEKYGHPAINMSFYAISFYNNNEDFLTMMGHHGFPGEPANATVGVGNVSFPVPTPLGGGLHQYDLALGDAAGELLSITGSSGTDRQTSSEFEIFRIFAADEQGIHIYDEFIAPHSHATNGTSFLRARPGSNLAGVAVAPNEPGFLVGDYDYSLNVVVHHVDRKA